MNEEPTREEVISYLSQCVWLESNDTTTKMLSKAIDFIQQAPKYRKKAKRWKRKYMSLRSEVEKMRAGLAESEDDEKKPHDTDIENSATKHWIFERVECISDIQDLWEFEFRCPNCFTLSSFFRRHNEAFSEKNKCPVCGEPLIFDPEDMFKNEKTN